MSDVTPEKDEKGRFVSGNIGGGRPKGSRNKLGEAFVSALYQDFQAHGAAAIAETREKDPAAYVRVCASLLPKELKVETVREVSEDELDARIARLVGIVGAEIGIAGASGGARTSH